MPTILRESDLENICGGCKKVHDNSFTSVWFDSAHYKIKSCEHCGYEISFRTADSSGLH
ncbi:hypothetical protein HQ533_01765 [Candidatus Woesearchaeota archaeon]|nr:hypothetical protein [Candidatus Woesearchaeota archaeon]